MHLSDNEFFDMHPDIRLLENEYKLSQRLNTEFLINLKKLS